MIDYVFIIIELLALSFLMRKNRYIYILILSIVSLQIVSVIMTGFTIPVLALENIGEIGALGNKQYTYFAIIFSSVFVISFIFRKIINRYLTLNNKQWNILALIALVYIVFSPWNVVNKFIKTSILYVQTEYAIGQSKDERNKIALSLIKDYVVKDTDSSNYIENKDYNVVVIFSEGLSKDVISQEITPNIYNLMSKGIVFNNYYNHTAATFRGLRGQLTSSYQLTGGYSADDKGVGQIKGNELVETYKDKSVIISIVDILNKNGYETIFQNAHERNSNLSIFLSTLGFNKIYGTEDMKSKKRAEGATDAESYELLFSNLKKYSEEKKKFFYAVYTLGTHVGLDSPDEKYGNGQNSYKNKFYNLDYQFGKFLEKFNKDSMSDDTILIFTVDHSTYPEKEFVETFKTKSPYFVDRVPLIIYGKNIKPNEIDVKGLNSLSLAPTILDILGIHNAKNMFLGNSLFSKDNARPENKISAIGFDYINTDENGVKLIDDQKTKDQILDLQKFGG